MYVSRKSLFAVLLGMGLLLASWADSSVKVSPDARVDLLSLVFHYAGNQEFSKFFLPEYGAAADVWFADMHNHPVIAMAREFHQKHGVSYDAISKLAIRLTPDDLQLISGSQKSLDPRWPREQLEEFLTQLRDFSRQSRFPEFYRAQVPVYQDGCKFWQLMLEKSEIISWLERFYGDKRPLRFAVIPSTLENGGVGPSLEMAGTFYCYIVVCHRSKAENLYRSPYSQQLKKYIESSCFSLLAHEFSHPWTNPVTLSIYPQIRATAEKFFPAVQEIMKRQAYGKPEIMMLETINRAAELVYIHDRYGAENAKELLARQKSQGFLLTERVYHCILAERQKGGTSWCFADSAQAYADCINAPESLQLLNDFFRARKNAPSILSFSPRNGAKGVSPSTREITVTFNKPMKKSMSICTRDLKSYPKIESTTYNSEQTVLTLKVQLKPDTEYHLWFNSGPHTNFSSTDGGVLPDTEYVFTTAAE